MKKTILFFIVLLMALTLIFSASIKITSAQRTEPGIGAGGVVTLPDPLKMEGEKDAPQLLVGKLINAVMGIVGSMALVMFIFGGLMWMLAAGNTERITRGKNILIWATVGLVVIFSSYAIVKFVLKQGLGGG